MSRIFWDTNLFIYLLEGIGTEAEQVISLRRRMLERSDELITSALTLGEILVKPYGQGRLEACDRYEQIVRANARIVPFDGKAVRLFAAIRSITQRKIHPADAMQLACAAVEGTDLFLTNDSGLHGLRVPGIQAIAPLQEAPV